MFNIGFFEFLVIGVIALIVIGPKDLPKVARTVGRLLNELKRASEDIVGTVKDTHGKAQNWIHDAEEQITEATKIEVPHINLDDHHEDKTPVIHNVDNDNTLLDESEKDSASENTTHQSSTSEVTKTNES